MARAFRRRGRGKGARYVATLDADERRLVASLLDQVHDLLEPPTAAAADADPFDQIVAGLGMDEERAGGEDPGERDPALDRLLPSAHRDDPEAAAEFRRLTEGGLRHRKALALAAASASLRDTDDVRLDHAGAVGFLTALTDVRLVLGERLGLRADDDIDVLERLADTLGDDDPLLALLGLYDFLSWLQETLAESLLEG